MNPLDPKTWPTDMQYLYRERAAIKEYCGGLDRGEAEKHRTRPDAMPRGCKCPRQ